MTREEEYLEQYQELIQHCYDCQRDQMPTPERCQYSCAIGIRLHYLEDEFSDITGWDHQKWHKDTAKKEEE